MKKLIFLITLTAVLGNGKLAWGMEELEEARLEGEKRYWDAQQKKFDALVNSPDFKKLQKQITEKQSEITIQEAARKQLEKEQPHGARTWNDIRTSHEIATQKLEHAQSALDDLQNDPLYKTYLELKKKLDARPSAPAASTPVFPSSSSAVPTPAPAMSPSAPVTSISAPSAPPKPEEMPTPPARRRPALRRPMFAVAGVAAATAALYATLKWYQRRTISRAVAGYNLKISQLSPTQKNALATALMARRRIPGSLRKLATLVRRPDFSSEMIPTATMWRLITELYYGETPTDERVASVKAILASQR